MYVDFSYYEGIEGVEIPEKNFRGIYSPNLTEDIVNIEVLFNNALENTIGCKPLTETIKPTNKVLIISDDNTRSTPVKELLHVLLPYLHNIGVKKDNITILIALGTHRPMNKDEILEKFGPQIAEQYRIVNHLWDKEEYNKYYGKTSRGIEVWGNKLLSESDYVIGLGHIVPHRVAGFSGGGKIVQPGVSNGKSTGETHWLSALVTGSEIMGLRDNLVREQIDEAAKLMGLDFIINVVQDLKGNVVGIFAGDVEQAHRQGCNLAKQVYGVSIPKADIVITDSYPADIELWQAAKGIYASELVVNDGGYVILVTPCKEGVAKTHPEVEKYGYLTLKEVEELLQKSILEEKSVAAHLVHSGRVIKEKANGILVCPNIPDETKKQLGFVPANSVTKALEYAFEKKGSDASVIVMKHAGELLPITTY